MLVGASPEVHLRMPQAGGARPRDALDRASEVHAKSREVATSHPGPQKRGEKIPQACRACRCDTHGLSARGVSKPVGGSPPFLHSSLPLARSIQASEGENIESNALSFSKLRLLSLQPRASEKVFFCPPSHPHHFFFLQSSCRVCLPLSSGPSFHPTDR